MEVLIYPPENMSETIVDPSFLIKFYNIEKFVAVFQCPHADFFLFPLNKMGKDFADYTKYNKRILKKDEDVGRIVSIVSSYIHRFMKEPEKYFMNVATEEAIVLYKGYYQQLLNFLSTEIIAVFVDLAF
jgi:hypothetical protein